MSYFKPPAVPLVTVDPYFSIYSMSDNLTDDFTRDWTGSVKSMTGMLNIDGEIYRFAGLLDGTTVMEQKKLEVKPLSSIYYFEAAGIGLEVNFTTPILLEDLELLSRPVSYISFRINSLDGREHSVDLYFDVTGEWCVNSSEQEIDWGRKQLINANTLYLGNVEQDVLGKSGDDIGIDWGYFHLITADKNKIKTFISGRDKRNDFMKKEPLFLSNDTNIPRKISDNIPLMVSEINFAKIKPGKTESSWLALAYEDLHSVEYFHSKLKSYCYHDGSSFDDILVKAVEEYDEIINNCNFFNNCLREEAIESGGRKYADIVSLAYRQSINAHKLVSDQNGKVLFFSKECFSNGCMGTVDVSYPSIPLYLIYNTELVKGMMRPIFRYAKSEEWNFDFAPHDVGQYPLANGQVYGSEDGKLLLEQQMPIEECGNMLIMMTAVSLKDKNTDFAEENWEVITQWGQYLLDYGLDPGNQLCTDDFAGHLSHNANLSIKAIMGIAGYGIMAGMLGNIDLKNEYLEKARQMAVKWEDMAADGDHYRLAFDQPGTWSLKYNLIWDILFETNLFSSDIKMKETEYYLKKQLKYGTPLDNREKYTKADWLVWAAAMTDSDRKFEKMIEPLWDFLNESHSRVPFTDWYFTDSGEQRGFQNRSVVGGVFIKLLKDIGLR